MKFTRDQSIVIVAAVISWMLLMLTCYLGGLAVHEIAPH